MFTKQINVTDLIFESVKSKNENDSDIVKSGPLSHAKINHIYI